MLFFFELFLFVLVMLTLALGEFVSRWLALILWLVVTGFALVGYLLARGPLSSFGPAAVANDRAFSGDAETAVDSAPDAGPSRSHVGHDAAPDAGPLDEKWARTLLYNWRRSNALLVLGAVVVAAWWWLAG